MNSISSATKDTSRRATISAGDLADMLKGVSAFVCENGPEWMMGAVEAAIAKITKAPRDTYKSRMDLSRMRSMLLAGATYKDMATAFNVTTASIGKYVSMWGLSGIKPRKKSQVLPTAMPRPWSELEDDQLKEAWARGDSCSDIAINMPGRTRNMVIGRAHRLGLPKRPSPIKRSA